MSAVNSGRTLFVGDVHGCVDELETLLATAQATRVVLLGDLFTKGPDAPAVWDCIRRVSAESVLGNQDARVLRLAEHQQSVVPAEAIHWLKQLPTHIEGPGWLAVHAGIDPFRGIEATAVPLRLNLRRWPDDSDDTNPFWWSLYQGDRLVLFGHDARRGLVDRRPHCLGLDTGCVYGGGLTGYLLEEDRLVQTPSRRVYHSVGVDR